MENVWLLIKKKLQMKAGSFLYELKTYLVNVEVGENYVHKLFTYDISEDNEVVSLKLCLAYI